MTPGSGGFQTEPLLASGLATNARERARLPKRFFKNFLHLWKFTVISSLRACSSRILKRKDRPGRKPSKLATASAPRQNLQSPTVIPSRKKSVRLTLWPLVAATFFMVSGGTYGTEDIVHGAGYGKAILILLLTPILWSLPTAFMIGELSSALPYEGGYYAWVRRAMGNFWGFQEAWLSLVASIFDMAIYPTLFVAYLTRLVPWFGVDHRGVMVGLGVVVLCALLNIAGIRIVAISSLWLFFLLSAPFVALVLIAPFKVGELANATVTPSTSNIGLIGGLL